MPTSPFSLNTHIGFLTKHKKESILQACFSQYEKSDLFIDAEVVHTSEFDTDKLGTFDHSIPRNLSPVEAALKKAYLSCELTGLQQGIGSEGSFTSQFGVGILDEEIIAFVDIVHKIEVIASAKQFVDVGPIYAPDEPSLIEQLKYYDDITKGKQKWLLQQDNTWHKGLNSEQVLELNNSWPTNIEPDFRAMNCPSRQQVIALAIENLLLRIHSLCPKCSAINFVPKPSTQHAYMKCEICKQATAKMYPPILECDKCMFSPEDRSDEQYASAFYCSFCNP